MNLRTTISSGLMTGTTDLSGTTGKHGLGVSAQLTPNAGVWAEARYENGRHTELPVTASVGFRINF